MFKAPEEWEEIISHFEDFAYYEVTVAHKKCAAITFKYISYGSELKEAAKDQRLFNDGNILAIERT